MRTVENPPTQLITTVEPTLPVSDDTERHSNYHLPKEILDYITDKSDDWDTYLSLRVALRIVDQEPSRAIQSRFQHPRCSKESLASLYASYRSNTLFQALFTAFRIHIRDPDPFGSSPETVVLQSFYYALSELGRRCCPNAQFPFRPCADILSSAGRFFLES